MRQRTERKKRRSGKTRVRVARKRIPGVPPADSRIWPEQYGGEELETRVWVAVRGQVPVVRVPLPPAEVAATKARDRKAYELHGDGAYLNRPEDFRR